MRCTVTPLCKSVLYKSHTRRFLGCKPHNCYAVAYNRIYFMGDVLTLHAGRDAAPTLKKVAERGGGGGGGGLRHLFFFFQKKKKKLSIFQTRGRGIHVHHEPLWQAKTKNNNNNKWCGVFSGSKGVCLNHPAHAPSCYHKIAKSHSIQRNLCYVDGLSCRVCDHAL